MGCQLRSIAVALIYCIFPLEERTQLHVKGSRDWSPSFRAAGQSSRRTRQLKRRESNGTVHTAMSLDSFSTLCKFGISSLSLATSSRSYLSALGSQWLGCGIRWWWVALLHLILVAARGVAFRLLIPLVKLNGVLLRGRSRQHTSILERAQCGFRFVT